MTQQPHRLHPKTLISKDAEHKIDTVNTECDIQVALVAAFHNIASCIDTDLDFHTAISNFKNTHTQFYHKIFTKYQDSLQFSVVVDDDPNIIIPERWFYILEEVALRLDNPSMAFFVHQVVLKLLATFSPTLFAKEKLTNLVKFFASTYEFACSKTSMVTRTVLTPITSIATPTPQSVITPLPPPPTKPIHNPVKSS